MWYDAKYIYDLEIPKETPLSQITIGFIASSHEDYVNVVMNVDYIPRTKIVAVEDGMVDGILIPKKTIIEFKKIGDFEKDDT